MPDNKVAFYQSPDGSANTEVLYNEGELDVLATCKDFLQVKNERIK